MSTVRPTVHSNPKTLFKLEEFEKAGFSLSCGRGKQIENGAYGNYGITIKHKFKMTGDLVLSFLNSPGVVWTENI